MNIKISGLGLLGPKVSCFSIKLYICQACNQILIHYINEQIMCFNRYAYRYDYYHLSLSDFSILQDKLNLLFVCMSMQCCAMYAHHLFLLRTVMVKLCYQHQLLQIWLVAFPKILRTYGQVQTKIDTTIDIKSSCFIARRSQAQKLNNETSVASEASSQGYRRAELADKVFPLLLVRMMLANHAHLWAHVCGRVFLQVCYDTLTRHKQQMKKCI